MTRYRVFILFCLLGFVINVNLFIDPVWGFIASLAGYFALNLVVWILVKRVLMRTGTNTETGNWIGGVIAFILSMYGYGLQFFPSWILSGNWRLVNQLNHENLLLVYKLLYFALLFIVPLLLFFISKKERGRSFLHGFLVCAVVVITVNRSLSYYRTYTSFTPKQVMDTGNTPLMDTARKPDIYYFILDGYTGNTALKKYWNFDNSNFTGGLRALNFKVADSARGNIAATIGALSFVFNLSVFNNPQLYEYNMDLITIKYIRNNTLFNVLRKNGYSIEGNSLFFDKKPYFFSQGEMHPNAAWCSNFITRHLLFRVIFKGVNILLKDTYTDNSWFFGYDKRTDAVIKKQINEAGSGNPGFYFNHLMITHPPYCYTDEGKPLGTDGQTKSKHHYLDQVKYTNTLCLGYFTALVNKYRELDKPLVIIAQSDHGSKELKLVEEDSQIQLMIYDSRNRVEITPQEDGINLMRKVLNKHLGYTLPAQPYEYYNLFQRSGRRE